MTAYTEFISMEVVDNDRHASLLQFIIDLDESDWQWRTQQLTPVHNRLGCKWQTVKNTPAYFGREET
jgi:hypothetical protein